jgi:hypothetical protein
MSASGDTGDVPVCCAKWWDGRREIERPVTIALPTAITPTDHHPGNQQFDEYYSAHQVSRTLPASVPGILATTHQRLLRKPRGPHHKG